MSICRHRKKNHVLEEGDIVQVRTEEEILATLDENGTLDGLPFMPEMHKYCGRRVKVKTSVNDILVEGVGYRKMLGCVLLQDVTCDGTAHGGCQRMCNIFWKRDWIRFNGSTERDISTNEKSNLRETHRNDTADVCQSARLKNATSLPSITLESFVRKYLCYEKFRKYWFLRKVGAAFLLTILFSKRFFDKSERSSLRGSLKTTPEATLNLDPGEMVVIKNEDEISATLDSTGKNRGLAFTQEMKRYCGSKYRVLKRINDFIDEASGEHRSTNNTVVLENVICDGSYHRKCPRSCFLLWREVWLRRV